MENQLSKFSVTELKALNRLQPPQGGLTNSDGSQPVVTQADFNPPTV